MPRLSQSVPKYRKHRASGQALVTVNGQDHYLGPHGTKASKVEYDRLIGERHYVKRGKQTGTADNFKPGLRLLKSYYGKTEAAKFRTPDLGGSWLSPVSVLGRADQGVRRG